MPNANVEPLPEGRSFRINVDCNARGDVVHLGFVAYVDHELVDLRSIPVGPFDDWRDTFDLLRRIGMELPRQQVLFR